MRSPVPDSRNVAFAVGDDEHRLEPAEDAIGAPVLGQLDRRALEVAAILFELRLEAREQREGIGRRSGEAGQNAIVVQPADLPRALLDDRLAERHLAVAREHGAIAVADGQNRGAVELGCHRRACPESIGRPETVSRKRDALHSARDGTTRAGRASLRKKRCQKAADLPDTGRGCLLAGRLLSWSGRSGVMKPSFSRYSAAVMAALVGAWLLATPAAAGQAVPRGGGGGGGGGQAVSNGGGSPARRTERAERRQHRHDVQRQRRRHCGVDEGAAASRAAASAADRAATGAPAAGAGDPRTSDRAAPFAARAANRAARQPRPGRPAPRPRAGRA